MGKSDFDKLEPDVRVGVRLKCPIMANTDAEFLKLLEYIKAHPLQITEGDIASNPEGVDYHEVYLKSKFWQRIRRRVLRRDRHTCKRCGGKADTVHHRSYDGEVLKGNRDDQLVSLCKGCHTFIEIDESDNKRPDEESERLLSEHDPDAFPDPSLTRVGPRKQEVLCPRTWDRLSAVQRARWLQKALRFGKRVHIGNAATMRA